MNTLTVIITLASLWLSRALGQLTPLNQFFKPPTFPNEQTENVTRYLNEAAAQAVDGSIHQYFQDQCITQQLYPPLFTWPSGYVQPFSPFEGLFFVGHSGVSAWAYNTTEGIVLIDTLDNEDEIKAILLPGLQSFGLNGSEIKHVIITHEHADHYGGAKYLQDTFKPAVYASELAWKSMAAMGKNATPPVPTKDRILADGDNLSVGGVDFHIVLTPGHTPGCLSLIFPVSDQGRQHMAGLSGGTGTPADAASREQKIRSQYKFADICQGRGVDVLLSNHQVADHALFHADILAHRTQRTSNPFIIGVDNFDKYMKINAICSKVIAAREGQDLQI
ncbi:hypothetical protein AFCA_000154 [Aspergillus flavus]|uniref:Metallo-beta-lactamase domain-containing protein n=1 Tax=Aspergillus flavus TaxID=5059 RepID=A0AB74BUR7_ASPFL|nr:hypothetical protein CA14_007667 [Aspergillus flavus]UCK57218.1 hypothetical protein AFCA_000154 [Aspergillus flavus]